MNAPAPLCTAEDLAFAWPGAPLLQGLDFALRPGLTMLRGGESRGKTTLLRLIAGQLAPQRGRLQRAGSVCLETPANEAHDAAVAADWLAARAAAHPGWNAAVAARLAEAFGLGEHLAKPMYMLSTGSRRKVGLVAAAASGASLTLLDMPFAAIDGASRRVLLELLAEASRATDRAWVLADHEAPALPAGAGWAGLIDLGD